MVTRLAEYLSYEVSVSVVDIAYIRSAERQCVSMKGCSEVCQSMMSRAARVVTRIKLGTGQYLSKVGL